MNKVKLKEFALKLLTELDLIEIETIEIENHEYPDGSSGLTISAYYPEKGGEDD